MSEYVFDVKCPQSYIEYCLILLFILTAQVCWHAMQEQIGNTLGKNKKGSTYMPHG